MPKARLSLRFSHLNFRGVLDLANAVNAGLTAASGTYTTPFPTLITLSTAATALDAAITKWGPVGNHGSHADHVDLVAKSTTVKQILVQLALYCMNTTPYDAVNLATTGFTLRNVNTPQGQLQKAEDFHQFISPKLNPGQIKLKWKKP